MSCKLSLNLRMLDRTPVSRQMRRNIQKTSFSQPQTKHGQLEVEANTKSVLTIEAIGMSNVTKTILVLQLASCIVVQSWARCCSLPSLFNSFNSSTQFVCKSRTMAAVNYRKLHLPGSFGDSLPCPAEMSLWTRSNLVLCLCPVSAQMCSPRHQPAAFRVDSGLMS